jgi:hypothetical protein
MGFTTRRQRIQVGSLEVRKVGLPPLVWFLKSARLIQRIPIASQTNSLRYPVHASVPPSRKSTLPFT